MQHSFDISIAEKYGINEAIFLNNLAFWIKKNQANNKHFHKERYWTYNSSEALSIIFPYWSVDQMDRLIKKCVSSGLLLVDNFNDNSHDRTRWYGLTDLAMELLNFAIPRNRGIETAKSKVPFREIAGCILEADINTDIKPDKREALSDNFIPDKTNIEIASRLGVDLKTELESFRNRWKGPKTQYEFSRWLKNAKDHSDRKKTGKFKEKFGEVRSTVKEWKQGNPDYDRVNGTTPH